jgi:arsenite methyltransferase
VTVSDASIPIDIQNDLLSQDRHFGGAFREIEILEAFEAAGFHGIQILHRQADPANTIDGIEFRRMTVQAFKGKAGPCLERHQAVIYKGPWKAVVDDDGHTLLRGQRMAVCDKTFQIYGQAPYSNDIIPVPPHQEIPLLAAKPMPCTGAPLRDPRQTKSLASVTTMPTSATPVMNLLPISDCCSTSECC